MCDLSREVSPKVGMLVAVLLLNTLPHAVRQDRLEPVAFCSRYVWARIDNYARDRLTAAAAQNARLAVVEGKPLFQRNHSNKMFEPARAACQLGTTGESEIVGVTRVGGVEIRRETGEAAVEAVRDQVGQRGRGWRALG